MNGGAGVWEMTGGTDVLNNGPMRASRQVAAGEQFGRGSVECGSVPSEGDGQAKVVCVVPVAVGS